VQALLPHTTGNFSLPPEQYSVHMPGFEEKRALSRDLHQQVPHRRLLEGQFDLDLVHGKTLDRHIPGRGPLRIAVS
jgi:hypothetical protein